MEPLTELLMNLPIGTQGKIMVLNEDYFLFSNNRNTERLCAQEPHRTLLGIEVSFVLYYTFTIII